MTFLLIVSEKYGKLCVLELEDSTEMQQHHWNLGHSKLNSWK